MLAEYQFAHVDDLRGEDLTCGPVGFNQFFKVEREWSIASESSEIEINCVDLAGIDDFSVGACFGGSECVEEVRPARWCDLADMLEYAKGAGDAALHFLGEVAL